MATRADRKREGEVRRVQRGFDRAAQRTANQARQEANSPTLRDPVPYATSQPVNPVGANGLREQRARTATRLPSRTEGLTQEQQAAMIGAGNQPAAGVGNGQPTMAERYQAASPEGRAAMAQSQGIQSVSPESYLIGGTGLVRTGAALGRGIARNVAGSRAAQTAVSALRNPAGRVGTRGPTRRVAGNRSGGRTDELLAPGRARAGREATPATGSGRSSVSDKAREASMGGKPRSTDAKPRVKANADGTVNYGATGAPSAAAATPGAAAATETAKTLAQRALGLGKRTLIGGAATAAGLGVLGGLRAGKEWIDDNFEGDFNALTQGPATAGESSQTYLGLDPEYAAAARGEGNSEAAQIRRDAESSGNAGGGSAPAQARSLLRRMEDGETLSQADFNAAGYDGQGIRVDGDRQGVGSRGGATLDADGNGPAVPVTANSRFEALRNRRLGNTTQEERRAGLRAGQERLALRREAFGDEPTAQEAQRRSLEGGMGRFETIQRRRGLTEEQRQAEATAMRDAAAADTASLQAARGLREEARQADQTAAVTDRDSARRAATSGLRAQGDGGRSGGGSVLGPGGNYSPENVASQAATQMPSIMANLRRSNLGDFYETPEDAQGSFQNFLGDAARAQSRGALPEWMDDRTIEDVFTLSHALAGAETKGVLGRIGAALPFVKPSRGTSGEMNISSTDTLQSLLNVMRAEDGDKWTDANGTSFQLSTVRGPSAQIYQRLKDQFREAGLLNETEE